jgi:acetyl coenzyme A synthetase (ADP forming)-like protein
MPADRRTANGGAMTMASVTEAAAYPISDVVDVALRDGQSIHIRPVQESDRMAIHAFFEHLSSDSLWFRFLGMPSLDWATNWSVDVDYADRYAIVATAGADRSIVAHGAYARIDADHAEVAFVVADAWQKHGIATIMLAHLAAAAERHRISLFIAWVTPANHRMVQVFRDSGFPVEVQAKDGLIEVEFPTSLGDDGRTQFDDRERLAATAAVAGFLRPRAVAVIGASHRRKTVGAEILANVIRGGFAGPVYPVNPQAGTIQGLAAYASIGDIPEPVDLAVVAVPAAAVNQVARECGAAGVRALLVVSAGFSEAGPDGVQRQHELLGICRDAGMRLIGPNCLGLLNTAADVRLDATFAAHSPPSGNVGFFSQSGGLGIAMIEAAEHLGIGISSFVSVGNKADVSGNDLLEYWEQDPATDVVLLYLESFGNPRRFARIARRVGASKPIIAVKSGRSPAGARATTSHTGALISASDVTVDALFRQAGVVRADTMHELFDVAALLSSQPAPLGDRVVIVTNGGGPGILCADVCQAGGLDIVTLSEEVRVALAGFLAPEASLGNPIDMIATASAADYGRVIEVLVAHAACDAIITIFVPPLVTSGHDVAAEIDLAGQGTGAITLASVFMGGAEAMRVHAGEGGRRVPVFDFPEDAAQALIHAVEHTHWTQRPTGAVTTPGGCRPDEAAAIIARALANGVQWLGPRDVVGLFDCYGLPLIATRIVAGADEAVTAASELGVPVALKAIATGLIHKTDAGAVALGLGDASSVRAGAHAIAAAVEKAGYRLEGLIVQPMAAAGVELLLGVVNDESFGPVIACGAGGTSVELLRDVAVRITPLSDLDAKEMLRSLRSFPLLDGYRGAVKCDLAALEDLLLRLSAMVQAHAEIAELDANPVVARADGALILDARVRVAPAADRRPRGALAT